MDQVRRIHPGLRRAVERQRVRSSRDNTVAGDNASYDTLPAGDQSVDAGESQRATVQHSRRLARQSQRDRISDVASERGPQRRAVAHWVNLWSGSTVVVLASGPSLTVEDVQVVKVWRNAKPDHRVIVTNTTFTLAPWADALFFHDAKWWKRYCDDVRNKFVGEKATVAPINVEDVTWLRGWDAYGNSGAGAMALAILAGAVRVIGLGIDCKYINGRRHWHGNHPAGLGNARSVGKWEAGFARLKRNHANVEILNASRDTDLKALPRITLEEALC
jgi:hypothetical protein